MTSIFEKLDSLIPTLEGWGEAHKSKVLAALTIAIRADVSCEIGVYGGRSFFGFALAHRELGHGIAIGIDPWSSDAATEGYDGVNKEFWKSVPMSVIHSRFMDAVNETGVGNVVQIHRKKSDEVEPPEKIDILHIDGQHTEQAVRDVNRFASKVRSGGFAVLDDVDWFNDKDLPVKRAAGVLLSLGFYELYPLGSGAVFQRK